MTFRIDNIKRSTGCVWISIKARNSHGWSEYFTLVSGADGRGLYHMELGGQPERWEVFWTKEEFEIGDDETPIEIAKRFAKAMIGRGFGPMLDMENDAVAHTIEDVDGVKFEARGHVGRYR